MSSGFQKTWKYQQPALMLVTHELASSQWGISATLVSPLLWPLPLAYAIFIFALCGQWQLPNALTRSRTSQCIHPLKLNVTQFGPPFTCSISWHLIAEPSIEPRSSEVLSVVFSWSWGHIRVSSVQCVILNCSVAKRCAASSLIGNRESGLLYMGVAALGSIAIKPGHSHPTLIGVTVC